MNDSKKISPIGNGIPTRGIKKNNSVDIIDHDSENIKSILEKLTELLQMTRHCSDVTEIKKIGEAAVVYHVDGSVDCVNIGGDSGIAAVYDVVKKLVF